MPQPPPKTSLHKACSSQAYVNQRDMWHGRFIRLGCRKANISPNFIGKGDLRTQRFSARYGSPIISTAPAIRVSVEKWAMLSFSVTEKTWRQEGWGKRHAKPGSLGEKEAKEDNTGLGLFMSLYIEFVFLVMHFYPRAEMTTIKNENYVSLGAFSAFFPFSLAFFQGFFRFTVPFKINLLKLLDLQLSSPIIHASPNFYEDRQMQV